METDSRINLFHFTAFKSNIVELLRTYLEHKSTIGIHAEVFKINIIHFAFDSKINFIQLRQLTICIFRTNKTNILYTCWNCNGSLHIKFHTRGKIHSNFFSPFSSMSCQSRWYILSSNARNINIKNKTAGRTWSFRIQCSTQYFIVENLSNIRYSHIQTFKCCSSILYLSSSQHTVFNYCTIFIHQYKIRNPICLFPKESQAINCRSVTPEYLFRRSDKGKWAQLWL